MMYPEKHPPRRWLLPGTICEGPLTSLEYFYAKLPSCGLCHGFSSPPHHCCMRAILHAMCGGHRCNATHLNWPAAGL